ncbi:hypothetical protein SAMN02799630_03815 [Paenibacillus sp. UNCCL117]|uniref:hypothetical protein n=1 Tax=unclassified Paenibacillus TaxID=185978 RepID=UPI000891042F|nr:MULTISPECIES: hypothetical protein [unclassified Paenibacillus]SDD59081.1 hypothetical protein SAMN04488602_110122 [Paenibacillus sp. cl123]SFW50886.1 hypothetical protein SAMN02799630_03815 [Paenibacillus sp. UNCCL117]
MSGFTYQRAYRFRKAATVLLAVTAAAAGWKTYDAAQAARAFDQARSLHMAGQLPEAEALYVKAGSIRGFDYHRDEIASALAELQPIVHMMRTVQSLSQAAASAAAAKDVSALAKTHSDWQAARQQIAALGAAHAERFAQAVQEASLEAQLATGFADARKAAEKRIAGAKAADDVSTAAAELILIPAVYYGGDPAKLKAINALLQPRDIARLDTLARTKPYVEVWKQGEELRTFYERQGWEAAWMAPKLEKLALGTLSILEKQDLEKFLEAARQLKAYPVWAGPGSKIEANVQSVVEARMKKAASLSAGGKHADAIALYKTLGSYRDTSAELRAAELQQLAADPAKLLTAAGADGKLTAVTALKAAAGQVQAAALDGAGTRLLLAQLAADGGLSLHEAALDTAVRQVTIRYSELSGPDGSKLLLLEGSSARRSARYVLLLVAENGSLRRVLDVEADALSSNGKGELTATRPWIAPDSSGNVQPDRGHYRFEDDRYRLIRTESEPREPEDNRSGRPSSDSAANPSPGSPPAGGPAEPGGGNRQKPPRETAEPGSPALDTPAGGKPAARRDAPAG